MVLQELLRTLAVKTHILTELASFLLPKLKKDFREIVWRLKMVA